MLPQKIIFKLPPYLKAISRDKSFAKREFLALPEDRFEDVYIIKSGLIKVYDSDTRGQQIIQAFYGPGDFFPVARIIHNQHTDVYYQAIVDTAVRLVPSKEFIKALKEDAEVSFNVMQQVINQTMLYRLRADNLGLQYARERLAFRLLLSAYRFGEKGEHGIELPAISQEDVAHAINLTRESVSKGMKRLEQLGGLRVINGRTFLISATVLINDFSSKQHLPMFFAEVEKMLALA